MCDTAHLATDMIGFIIGLVCLNLARKEANSELTYGWKRSEVIGSLCSVIILIAITTFLVGEAVKRVLEPGEIDADMMMFTAVIGLVFNLIQMYFLHDDMHIGSGGHGHSHEGGDDEDLQYHGGHEDHGHSHDHGHGKKKSGNMNVDQAYLHALSDALNSVGVCIASVIIWVWP